MKPRIWAGIVVALAALALISCGGDGGNFTNVSRNSSDSLVPKIVVDRAGEAHLTWVDLTPGQYSIFYSEKPVGGGWSKATDVSQSRSFSTMPALAVDSQGTAHVVWYGDVAGNNEVFYASKPRGGSWVTPVNISNNEGASENPVIAVDSAGGIHVAWQDYTAGNNEIFYAMKSGDGPWSAPANISNTSGFSQNSAIAVDSGNTVHLVWQDDTPGNQDIFYAARSADGSWSAARNISSNTNDSQSPSIAVDSQGNPHVAWHDYSISIINLEVLYSARNKEGSWSAPENVSRTVSSSGVPQLFVDSKDTVHLVWNDNAPGNFDIFYVNKPSGKSWSDSKNITENARDSGSPAIAVDSKGNVHIAWNDQNPGNWDILYTVLPGPEKPASS